MRMRQARYALTCRRIIIRQRRILFRTFFVCIRCPTNMAVANRLRAVRCALAGLQAFYTLMSRRVIPRRSWKIAGTFAVIFRRPTQIVRCITNRGRRIYTIPRFRRRRAFRANPVHIVGRAGIEMRTYFAGVCPCITKLVLRSTMAVFQTRYTSGCRVLIVSSRPTRYARIVRANLVFGRTMAVFQTRDTCA